MYPSLANPIKAFVGITCQNKGKNQKKKKIEDMSRDICGHICYFITRNIRKTCGKLCNLWHGFVSCTPHVWHCTGLFFWCVVMFPSYAESRGRWLPSPFDPDWQSPLHSYCWKIDNGILFCLPTAFEGRKVSVLHTPVVVFSHVECINIYIFICTHHASGAIGTWTKWANGGWIMPNNFPFGTTLAPQVVTTSIECHSFF